MKKDITAINEIISKMLGNSDEFGVYPTGTAYLELEQYIEGERAQAIGRMYADACVMQDRGEDIRVANMLDILLRVEAYLKANNV